MDLVDSLRIICVFIKPITFSTQFLLSPYRNYAKFVNSFKSDILFRALDFVIIAFVMLDKILLSGIQAKSKC